MLWSCFPLSAVSFFVYQVWSSKSNFYQKQKKDAASIGAMGFRNIINRGKVITVFQSLMSLQLILHLPNYFSVP